MEQIEVKYKLNTSQWNRCNWWFIITINYHISKSNMYMLTKDRSSCANFGMITELFAINIDKADTAIKLRTQRE